FSCVFLMSIFDIATAPTESYTLSLHDALPIFDAGRECRREVVTATQRHGEAARHFLRVDVLDAGLGLELVGQARARAQVQVETVDRKSTRLNSSHVKISYAVFCLKKKRNQTQN